MSIRIWALNQKDNANKHTEIGVLINNTVQKYQASPLSRVENQIQSLFRRIIHYSQTGVQVSNYSLSLFKSAEAASKPMQNRRNRYKGKEKEKKSNRNTNADGLNRSKQKKKPYIIKKTKSKVIESTKSEPATYLFAPQKIGYSRERKKG